MVFVPVAFGLAKRVEPELGSLNLVRLLVFANTAAALMLFVNLFILYVIFRNPAYLYAATVMNLELCKVSDHLLLDLEKQAFLGLRVESQPCWWLI